MKLSGASWTAFCIAACTTPCTAFLASLTMSHASAPASSESTAVIVRAASSILNPLSLERRGVGEFGVGRGAECRRGCRAALQQLPPPCARATACAPRRRARAARP